jgi:hypothetical protein
MNVYYVDGLLMITQLLLKGILFLLSALKYYCLFYSSMLQ